MGSRSSKRFSDNLSAPCKFQWRCPVSAWVSSLVHSYLNGSVARWTCKTESICSGKRGSVRVRIIYAYNDPLSEAPRLSSPPPPLPSSAYKTDSNVFFFFHSFFARLQQTRSIFPPSSGWNAPRRGACDEFARVTESREFSYFRRDDRQKGM